MSTSYDQNIGRSTFTILQHMSFRVVWDGTLMATWDQMYSNDPQDWTYLELVLSSGDTTVIRQIQLKDLWEEVPEILAAALSAWAFLVEPKHTM